MTDTMQDIYDRKVAEGELTADPAQHAVLPVLDAIRAHFATVPEKKGLLGGLFAKPPEPPKGVYLWGGVGRGKSMLMDMFAEHVPTTAKRRVHFHAFMQEVHAGIHKARQKGVEDSLKPVAEALVAELRLLCLDEMQISDITDAMLVGRLFSALFAGGVVVVTTSNRPPDDLYKDGLNRALFVPFIAEIKARTVVHHLQSPTDYRQDRLAGSDSYFTPVNAAARAALDRLWNDLTGGQWAPLSLMVQGREVVLPGFSNGVARVPFWELCGRPLGPADYLAVAAAVRVLILEDVPNLGRNNFNEARRFVTLIDALYEGHVQLIVSAADIPERLYVEGEGSFEFERTASRLREMQSADWVSLGSAS
jgi:cell division protein ZapE